MALDFLSHVFLAVSCQFPEIPSFTLAHEDELRDEVGHTSLGVQVPAACLVGSGVALAVVEAFCQVAKLSGYDLKLLVAVLLVDLEVDQALGSRNDHSLASSSVS
jgi:hypothetical protein